jgi:heme/copper-type cytochrome/quinol oxidase subunit 2
MQDPDDLRFACRRDDWIETYKSLVTLSTEAFKFCALANGGAAVAILAYLGNVAGKDHSVPVSAMRCLMAAFLAGLVFCGVAMLFAYCVHFRRLNRLAKAMNPKGDWPLLIIAMVFAILRLSAFATGSLLAVESFK